MKRAAVLVSSAVSSLVLVAALAPAAQAAPYSVSGTDPSGDTAVEGPGGFPASAKNSVDVINVAHAYVGESDSLGTTVRVAGSIAGNKGYRQDFDLVYTWGEDRAAVVTVTHRVKRDRDRLNATVAGAVPGWCDTVPTRLVGKGSKLRIAVRLGCFSGATPDEVDAAVRATLTKQGGGESNEVVDLTEVLTAPLPAATTDPETGDVTQPDVTSDTTLTKGSGSGGDTLRAMTDLERVVFSDETESLDVAYCTVAAYDSEEARRGTFTGTFVWQGANGINAKLVVQRGGAGAPTATYTEDDTAHEVEAAIDGTCTVVSIPWDLVPDTVTRMKISSSSKVVGASSYYDRTPETTLEIEAAPARRLAPVTQ